MLAWDCGVCNTPYRTYHEENLSKPNDLRSNKSGLIGPFKSITHFIALPAENTGRPAGRGNQLPGWLKRSFLAKYPKNFRQISNALLAVSCCTWMTPKIYKICKPSQATGSKNSRAIGQGNIAFASMNNGVFALNGLPAKPKM